MLLNCSVFNNKIAKYGKKEETVTHGLGKKSVNRNCLWGDSDVELGRQKFQNNYDNYVQKIKRNHVLEGRKVWQEWFFKHRISIKS